MFSLAIYDTLKLKLFLCRDPFGIKPLYYYLGSKKKFSFCSEIKGLIINKKKIKEDNKSILDFIKWSALDHSQSTWFKHIYNVEPGTFLEINKNFKVKKIRYYFFKKEVAKQKIKNINFPLKFKKLLEKSVKSQIATVRTIGSNLSGGVDSSIVTKFLSSNKKNINTYTFGYNEKEYDERMNAKKICKLLNLKNFTSVCTSADINKYFIDTLIMQDEPFTSFRQVSHHKLYRDFKKSGSTVILEASGGDEIGAGYAGFLYPYFLDQISTKDFEYAWKELIMNLNKTNQNAKNIIKFIMSGMENQISYGINTSDGSRIINENCINKNFEKKFDCKNPKYPRIFDSNLKNSQYIEFFHTKLPRGLRYVDRASSASGREARVPLLSKELVEFCFAVPNQYKIRNGELRWFMKKSLNYFDKNFINLSNKKSIADPQRDWIRKNFKKMFFSLFNSKKFKDRKIFNQKEVLKNYKLFINNKKTNSLGIFQIFVTEIWFRLFIDGKPNNYRGAKLDEFITSTNY